MTEDSYSAPIRAACDRFEERLRTGEKVSIEDCLIDWEEPARSQLLAELLRIEIELLAPSDADEYRQRFPEAQSQIERLSSDKAIHNATQTVTTSEDEIAATQSIAADSSLGQGDKGQFKVDKVASDRFRILRPHAKGGLGEVSIAKDEELNREVALKEIRARFADDDGSRARFILEAEVTGGLEHPGIVPVYGLGHF